MVWSNGQGTIWRGAMLVGLLSAGLAWTQTPPNAGVERIMVVHENGKATRCKIVESWQLPDRRMAHLLQGVDSGEMITIVDEQAPSSDPNNVRAMAKRIFAWGAGRRTPPEGSPIPPRMRIDSGLVLKHESSPPNDALKTNGPAIVNRVVDDQALGSAFGVHPDGSIRVTPKEPSKADGQVVEFNPPVVNVGGQAPAPAALPSSSNPPSIPLVPTLMPNPKPNAPSPIPQQLAPATEPSPPIVHEMGSTIIEPAKRSWRPGDKLQAWLLNRSAKRSEVISTTMPPTNLVMDKPGAPAPTAPLIVASGAPETKKPNPVPLAISTKPAGDKVADLPGLEGAKSGPAMEKGNIWGAGAPPAPPAKKSPEVAQLPEAQVNPLFAPDRITPNDNKLKVRPEMVAPAARPSEQWPLNSQSVLAARSGMQGPVTYVPYPIVTVPQPHHPPVPPDPKLPEGPQLNAFVNAFSPPPMPPGQANPGQPGMMPQGNPMFAQQQMMQQQMMQQQMMQQAMAQQRMMPNGDPRMAFAPPQGPNFMMAPYRQPSTGPMANSSRQYQGPLPPNLVPGSAPVMQAGYAPPPQMPRMPMMPPQQPLLQPVGNQPPGQAPQSPVAQQIDQLIRALRESPYPSQREWAAQQLVNFEWRAHPHILHAMLMSASQDPAVSVRAGCVYCLGRMEASVEPVLGTLNAMRNDADPRVRQEVANTLTRFSQAQAAAR